MPLRSIVLLLTLILLTTACASINANSRDDERRVIYGLTLQPSGFDPHIHASSELTIPLRQVYDTLVYRDPNTDDFVSGLAESWTVSDDGLVYTFTLRQGVTFHDGTAFNAAAVAATLDRILDPATGSQRAAFMLGTYQGYELIDDFTIRLFLAEPYAPLLDSLSQVYLGIASPAALQEYGLERYQFYQVGTGPFRFVEYVPGERLVIERRTDYTWGPSFYTPPGDNAVNVIEFRFFTDPPTRALALENGEANVMGELLPLDARAFANSGEASVRDVRVPGQPLQFLINTTQFPTDTRAVRQALLFGTNREAIIDAVFQRLSPIAWGPLSAANPFYNADVTGAYAYDPNQARQLLADSGFEDTDGSGFVDFGGADVTLTVVAPTWGLIPETVQLMQDQWRDIGLQTEIVTVPTRNALFERIEAEPYHLAAYYEFGADPAFLSRYFSSVGDLNWTRFADPQLDSLLFEAQRQPDINARRALYAQAQRTIVEQALVLPIRDYVNLNGVSSAVGPLTFDAYGWSPILNNLTWAES